MTRARAFWRRYGWTVVWAVWVSVCLVYGWMLAATLACIFLGVEVGERRAKRNQPRDELRLTLTPAEAARHKANLETILGQRR